MDRRNLLKGAVALIVAPASALAIPVTSASDVYVQTLEETSSDWNKELNWKQTERGGSPAFRNEYLNHQLICGMMIGMMVYVHDGGKDLSTYELELEDQLRAKYGMEPRKGVTQQEKVLEAA